MRAFGKGFEELYDKSREAGVRYIRGIPGEVEEDPETGALRMMVENTTTQEIEEHEFDMIVLSVGARPQSADKTVRRLLTLSSTADGFLMEAHPKLKPVDAPTKGVYIAGCAEAPKDVKDSVTQAGAAAARARSPAQRGQGHRRVDHRGRWTTTSATPAVCARWSVPTARSPPTRRPRPRPRWSRRPAPAAATAAPTCAFEAISMRHFTDGQIMAQVDALLAENNMEKVIVFACNWCSYAGGDTAGISRMQYPASNRLIRTMCSARVDEAFVLRAFRKGAPVVLVSGCHFSDCHYIDANRQTVKRMYRLWKYLEKRDIRPERLQLEWISAAEGPKFQKTMRQMEELRRTVTAEEVEHTVEVLEAEHEKKLAKLAQEGGQAGEVTKSGEALEV